MGLYRTAVFKADSIARPSGRRLFIAPDHSQGTTAGKGTLSVGRKVYTFDRDRNAFARTPISGNGIAGHGEWWVEVADGVYVNGDTGERVRLTTDGDELLSRPSSADVADAMQRVEDANRVQDGQRTRAQVQADRDASRARGEARRDTAAARRAAAEAARAQREADRDARRQAEADRKTQDAAIRAMVSRLSGKPFTGPITGRIRQRYLDAVEAQRQHAEMVSA